VGVDHDCRIALAGGLSGRPGIVQIAGTGSSCFGMNASGESWRSGGWGHVMADEGSSYWFGVEALRAAVRAYDGRGPQTELLDRVRERLRLAEMNDIMRRVYVEGMAPAEIAALAPDVIAAARRLDPVACQLVQQGAREIADCVVAVAQRLGMEGGPCELALVGGLFQADDAVIPPLRERLAESLPGCRVQMADLPPVLGACLLALQSLGLALPALERLHALRGPARIGEERRDDG
jgi:N-acetylglucosamine kinase-like BadF-type ATPase